MLQISLGLFAIRNRSGTPDMASTLTSAGLVPLTTKAGLALTRIAALTSKNGTSLTSRLGGFLAAKD